MERWQKARRQGAGYTESLVRVTLRVAFRWRVQAKRRSAGLQMLLLYG